MNVKALFGAGLMFVKKYQRPILTGLQIGGAVTSVIFAIKDSKKILAAVDAFNDPNLTATQKLAGFAKASVRVGTPLLVSVGAGIGGYKVASDAINNALGMAATYKFLNDTKDAALTEALGEDEAKEVIKKVNNKIDEKIEKNRGSVGYSEAPTRKIINTGEGMDLFHDKITNSWFHHDLHKVKDIILELNYAALSCDICVDEYAAALGVPAPDGDERKWRASGMNSRTIDPKFIPAGDDKTLWWEIEFSDGDMPKEYR